MRERARHTILTGVVRRENGQLCIQYEGYLWNAWLCGGVYRTTGAERDAGAEYAYAAPDGVRYFSVKP